MLRKVELHLVTDIEIRMSSDAYYKLGKEPKNIKGYNQNKIK
jgi:hypothetical protein